MVWLMLMVCVSLRCWCLVSKCLNRLCWLNEGKRRGHQFCISWAPLWKIIGSTTLWYTTVGQPTSCWTLVWILFCIVVCVQPTMLQWIEIATKLFNTDSRCCEWFMNTMAEDDWWPQQILIKCPNHTVRQVCTGTAIIWHCANAHFLCP